jgi:hypothetical protein
MDRSFNSMNGMNGQEALLAEIEQFMERHGISDATFGEKALKDGHLISEMRSARTASRSPRKLRRSTVNRLRRFMARFELDAVA